MAGNVLGVLFADIANAIREKTGDTATMKPNEFPAKISAIEVGGGGGGGSLPAGIYFQYVCNKPKYFIGIPFVFNDCIHLLTKTDGAKELLIYKLEDETFTSVATITTTTSLSIVGAFVPVVNGKAHIFAGQYHFVWDGSAFTQKSNTPVVSTGSTSSACNHNGELYWTETNNANHNIYVWDENTDTWSIKIANVGNGTLPATCRGIIFSHGGVLYYANGDTNRGIYRIIDGSSNVEVFSDTLIYRYAAVMTDKGLYSFNGVQLTLNDAILGRIYDGGNYTRMIEFNGALYFSSGSSNYSPFTKICIIGETEQAT
jgi:hypothetical protein